MKGWFKRSQTPQCQSPGLWRMTERPRQGALSLCINVEGVQRPVTHSTYRHSTACKYRVSYSAYSRLMQAARR